MSDNDAFITIGRLILGAAGGAILSRTHPDYRQAVCNLHYARSVEQYVKGVVMPFERPGADKTYIVMNLVAALNSMDINDPAVRDDTGARMEASVMWQQRFLDALTARRAAAGFYLTGANEVGV